MNALTVVAFACVAAIATAAPSGVGVVVSGPSGVVTDHGPIGPVGHGWDDGRWDDGRWDDGSWDDGRWDGGWGGHSNVVHGNGAVLVGASAGHASIVGPSIGHGLGGLGGLGGWGRGVVVGGWGGHGLVGHGHGVVVKGPPTVPATIVGPAGKVVADGLWGPTHKGVHW